MTTRQIALAGLFVALGWSLGWALAAVPNVELLSATAFSAGVLLGARIGTWVGALAMLLFSLLNPFGPVALPVLAAQVSGMALFGAAGGWAGGFHWGWGHPSRSTVLAAAAGLFGTLVYDLLTNLGSAFAFGFQGRLAAYLLAGMAFAVVHVVANVTIFCVLGGGVLPELRRRERRRRAEA